MSDSEQFKGIIHDSQKHILLIYIYLKRNCHIIRIRELSADTCRQMNIRTTLQNAFDPAVGTKLQTSDGCCEFMHIRVFCLFFHSM